MMPYSDGRSNFFSCQGQQFICNYYSLGCTAVKNTLCWIHVRFQRRMGIVRFFYRFFFDLFQSYLFLWGGALLVSSLIVLSPLLHISFVYKEFVFYLANAIGITSLVLAIIFVLLASGIFLLHDHEYVIRTRMLLMRSIRGLSLVSLSIVSLFFLVGSLYSTGIMLQNVMRHQRPYEDVLSMETMANAIAYITPLPVIIPTATPRPIVATPTPKPPAKQWGVAVQIDEHDYTMQVGNDSVAGSAKEIFDALNNYRKTHGSGTLSWDDKLADYAKKRVDTYIAKGGLDQHAGFKEFVSNPDNFKQIGFMGLGENASWGYTLSGVHLIEWVYAGDAPHNNNQLNPSWTHVGIGAEGSTTDIIFGKK